MCFAGPSAISGPVLICVQQSSTLQGDEWRLHVSVVMTYGHILNGRSCKAAEISSQRMQSHVVHEVGEGASRTVISSRLTLSTSAFLENSCVGRTPAPHMNMSSAQPGCKDSESSLHYSDAGQRLMCAAVGSHTLRVATEEGPAPSHTGCRSLHLNLQRSTASSRGRGAAERVSSGVCSHSHCSCMWVRWGSGERTLDLRQRPAAVLHELLDGVVAAAPIAHIVQDAHKPVVRLSPHLAAAQYASCCPHPSTHPCQDGRQDARPHAQLDTEITPLTTFSALPVITLSDTESWHLRAK